MEKRIIALHNEVIPKKEILEQARIQLKKEFIGIDGVIDQLIDSVSSWFMFPDMQEKPVIINLWGLTGTGKSSLVKRLSELIQYDQKYYRFDLGESYDREWAIKSKMESIYQNINGYPVIIALDEFQHARTIDRDGKEMDKSASRVIWDLLDSGKFQISRYSHQLEELYDLILKLHYVLRKGLKVVKGRVINKKEFFVKEMDLREQYSRYLRGKEEIDLKNIQFVPKDFHNTIYSLGKELFKHGLEVKAQLHKMDGRQTIELLKKVFDFANSPKTVDCSKALIFVLGNLDEAYAMSNDFNPDMSADEFHEQSLKITISQVKNALRHRFRNEQIARLGNTHIIYPAFSKDSFMKIIKLELEKIHQKIIAKHKLKICYDESILDLIYKEGVYPTQGTRPVYTTIHHVIYTRIGKIFSELILNKLRTDKIIFRAKNDSVFIDYFKNKKIIHSFSEKQILNLEKLRKNRQDDLQAISAVHESGHAVISAVLLKTIPEFICSVTAEEGTNGFVFTKFKWKYIAKNQILKRTAMFLGGIVAEKIVFGEENITAGADEDLRKVSAFVTDMIKVCGFGTIPAAIQVKDHLTNDFLHDESNSLNDLAKEWILQAYALADKILSDNKILLLRMADYLSDNRIIGKEQIKKMLLEHAKNIHESDLIENGENLFYRNYLKSQIAGISIEKEKVPVDFNTFEFSLNQNTNENNKI